MNTVDIFSTGTNADIAPKGDPKRQAVDSLRGYAYQVIAAALAWLDIGENGRLFLEVAEDYAILAEQALKAVQVKDTKGSGSITLNSENIRDAIVAFVDLVGRNPGIQIDFRYFTTSEIGTEKTIADRFGGIAGLEYWRKVAIGADPTPLRAILESEKFPESVREFSKARNDTELRQDLFERIHWNCGKPDFSTLRQEFEERLVVIGRDRFKLPASEARQLADPLIFKVLSKSIGKAPEERALKRAELYSVIDEATQIPMQRAVIEEILKKIPSMLGPLGGNHLSKALSTDQEGWITDGSELPLPRGMVQRSNLESATKKALIDFGVCILIGSTGLGKSNVSRAVARARGDRFSIIDFGDGGANENYHLLHTLFIHVGGLQSSLLILEDLNHLDDRRVASSVGRVIEAIRRRDRVLLITCYRKPSADLLAGIRLDYNCVVECPYFLEEEARALVSINGGDPNIWGRLAYIAGAGGHPQLTHAFVIGVAARGWPAKEIRDIVTCGLSTNDIDDARDAARRNLVSELPEGPRNILYRISLTTGRFSRSLALAIGALPPPISAAGECMDQLVGPWIETVGKDLYRVSPIARSFGREMLSFDDQTHIHEVIANQMLCKRKIDLNDINSIMIHAIAGKSSQSLAILAQSILTVEAQTLEALANHFSYLPLFQTDRPIFPEDCFSSTMLRLAQFKLATAASVPENVAEIVTALFNEISSIPAGEQRNAFEGIALFVVLGTMGIANYLDDWILLLHRFKALVESDNSLHDLKGNVENQVNDAGTNLFGILFSIGSAGLASVEQLEHIINELDKLDESERKLYLAPVDKVYSDYSIFINSPWVSQQQNRSFNGADTALHYQRIAAKVRYWGIRSLAIQCWVTQAVLFDEYENEMEKALAVLDNAATIFGSDPILSRARAKIYGHHNQHSMALSILRAIEDQAGGDNSIGSAFALREAAISAAKCDDWPQAEKWFLEAKRSAEHAQSDNMRIMALGLGADAAVAAFKAGDAGHALERLAKTLEGLTDIDPNSSLRAAHCHRIIRHTVLWLQSQIEGRLVKIDEEPLEMLPGTCSNPEPTPAIRELPLGHIDLAWYMLAQAEVAAGLNVEITAQLPNRLTDGPIPAMEFFLLTQRIKRDIDNLDISQFSIHLWPFIEAVAHIAKQGNRLQWLSDPIMPERGQIALLDKNAPFDPAVKQTAIDAILAFCMHTAMVSGVDPMLELEAALASEFADNIPGREVFESWKTHQKGQLGPLDQTIIDVLKAIIQKEHIDPFAFWMAGLRLLEKINQTRFKQILTPSLSAWQRSGWKQITTTEAFRLKSPSLNIPVINEVLSNPLDDRRFIAKLLLVSSEAVGIKLEVYRSILKAMAEEVSP